jgi:hypothetical protein
VVLPTPRVEIKEKTIKKYNNENSGKYTSMIFFFRFRWCWMRWHLTLPCEHKYQSVVEIRAKQTAVEVDLLEIGKV